MSFYSESINTARRIPVVGGILNRFATNKICKATSARPRAFSLWSHVQKQPKSTSTAPAGEYTTWPMLTDRDYSSRHLPPATKEFVDTLPADVPPSGISPNRTYGEVTQLFQRTASMEEDRSSMLFMFFAQWFTDSILRIDPCDRRKNDSNHNIDLCQIYGLTETVCRALRDSSAGKGLLRSQTVEGQEYPDYLGEVDDQGTWSVKEIYAGLPHAQPKILKAMYEKWPEERKHHLYATGLERGNSSIGYSAISTIFLREHNRLARELSSRNPNWDDERLFQTARMINTVILMKLVVEDYINHIAGFGVFKFDPSFAEKQNWYRTPWIALEFDLLYRWHGLVPDNIEISGSTYDHSEYRVNNKLLESAGIDAILQSASTQAAGRISLQNTPGFLLDAEYAMLKMGRDFRLKSYNDYRVQFGLDPIRSFTELTSDAILRAKLESMYTHIDNVEFIVGLFAEKSDGDDLYGGLMYAMVAYDAFTQIYTNPLLSKNVYHEETFTAYGLEIIEQTDSVEVLANRNTSSSIAVRFGV